MLSLSDLSRFYLDFQETYNRPCTVFAVRLTMNAVNKFWGPSRGVESLTTQDLTAFITARRSTRPSPHSINVDLRNVRGLLNYGVNNGLLAAPPFKVKLLRVNKKRQIAILTAEQIRRLISFADQPHKSIIIVAASTGMRLGEIVHLTWRDVIPEEKRIMVTAKNGWEPKSHQERSIPATDKLLALFATRREQSNYQAPDDYVFPSRDGKARVSTSVNHSLLKIWKRAGIHRRGNPTLHHLRHTAASAMLNGGASLETVRVILGHASITTTALYLHTTDAHKREAIDKLNVW